MEISEIHSRFLKCSSLSIDTRKIQKDSFFVAIQGERFDANTFAAEALEKGAAYVIIDNPDFYIDERTIVVSDSLNVLQQLAKFHRAYLKLPIIALTGSNGKTTTKELIYAILSKNYNATATVGNLNNHIGVPLTLLSFNKETEIGIVEMGANHQKEIEFLCNLAAPDFGYITNFGKAHLEGFGGFEGVIKGKSEIFDYLKDQQKLVFVNLDDPTQVDRAQSIKQFTFGVNRPDADVNIQQISANPFVHISYDRFEIDSKLVGMYNVANINAAVAIGKYFEVSDEDIKLAIENYIPANNRSQLMVRNGVEIILDAYNANPSSMAAALAHFSDIEKPHKVAILGDMFELGAESLDEHKALVESLIQRPKIETWFIGKDFYTCKIDHPHLHFYKDFDAFSTAFKVADAEIILIKGSRGMALERTLNLI